MRDRKVKEKKIEKKREGKEECLKLKTKISKQIYQRRNESLVNANYEWSEHVNFERSATNRERK